MTTAAAQSRSSRPRNAPPAPTVTVEELQVLCDEYDIELMPALIDQRYYHVTFTDELDSIAQQGLLPGAAADRRNFADLPLDERSVYLDTSVGASQQYAWGHRDRFGDRPRTILQVRGVQLATVRPDHEAFANMWTHLIYEESPLLDRVRDELGDDAPTGEIISYEDSILTLDQLSAHTNALLAAYCAADGAAVMTLSSIAADDLSVAQLATWEGLQEAFGDIQKPPDHDEEFDEEADDAYNEAFEIWVSETFPGLELIAEEDLNEKLADLEWSKEDADIVHYQLTPLREHGS